jgi:hypothetical protein
VAVGPNRSFSGLFLFYLIRGILTNIHKKYILILRRFTIKVECIVRRGVIYGWKVCLQVGSSLRSWDRRSYRGSERGCCAEQESYAHSGRRYRGGIGYCGAVLRWCALPSPLTLSPAHMSLPHQQKGPTVAFAMVGPG